MTNEEISNEFDTIVSSNNPLLKFDEYEKSVLLTAAQESFVTDYYSGRNRSDVSFEGTEEVRRYLDSLINTVTTNTRIVDNVGLSINSQFFKIPDDVWYITYETSTFSSSVDPCINGVTANVIPITQDTYFRINSNPFRDANRRRVLRLDVGGSVVELISPYTISSYLVRYVTKPTPIILIDLPDNLSIDGIKIKTECGLSSITHRLILDRAVLLALTRQK